jgi:hypothetical protein
MALSERPTSGVYRNCPDMTPRKSPGCIPPNPPAKH